MWSRSAVHRDDTVFYHFSPLKRADRVKTSRRLRCSKHRRRGQRQVKGQLGEAGKSLAGFLCGLLLASLYGSTVLLLQGGELWFCVYSTATLALLASFSMGLSASARANVMLMLPMLLSAKGRRVVVFFIMVLLLSGPLANILQNFERAADSLVCGAELAQNHTQEAVQRSASPLMPVLDSIRELTSNARSVAGRVHHFIQALTDNTRHIARTLKNVLHFLVDIGDVCNDKMGRPYRKCTTLFNEARDDCTELLGIFNFLCDIIDGFRPFCGLARAGQLFCVIPSYIAQHLKKRLAAPAVAAFERMKKEFEFSVQADVTFDLDVDSSRSLHQASQDILDKVSLEVRRFQGWAHLLPYLGLLLLGLAYFQAARYRQQYLHQDDFDNVFITEEFVELDERGASEGQSSILPLNRRESGIYITSVWGCLTRREQQGAVIRLLSSLRHAAPGGLLLLLDLLVSWSLHLLLDLTHSDVIARPPVLVGVEVKGEGYAADIFKDVVAAFNVLQTGNITVLSRKCLVKPSAPNYSTYLLIGVLYGLSMLLTVTGSYFQRFRRLICAYYYPAREHERILFLHTHIRDQRRILGNALRSSVTRTTDNRGGGGEGGAEEQFLPLVFRVPGASHLSRLLGGSAVTCLTCLEKGVEPDMVTCPLLQCKALYCRCCSQMLGNICVLCSRPLTFLQDQEEERDSSDEEHWELRTRLSMVGCSGSSDSSCSFINMPCDDQSSDPDRTSSLQSASDLSFHSAVLESTAGP
ncbi:DC-STAMP domain-containing protein 2 [Merluccius polli]|uniref:DC-STAMP domain-containing protein 2 n=1 Tax=Merluccius polli TaxID=89951 RepID=A0AA47MSY9_MERPO|nr:DC-STAMP domain-containing protein 2 [Merluccius polli]